VQGVDVRIVQIMDDSDDGTQSERYAARQQHIETVGGGKLLQRHEFGNDDRLVDRFDSFGEAYDADAPEDRRSRRITGRQDCKNKFNAPDLGVLLVVPVLPTVDVTKEPAYMIPGGMWR
jgi:hypothetical protein